MDNFEYVLASYGVSFLLMVAYLVYIKVSSAGITGKSKQLSKMKK